MLGHSHSHKTLLLRLERLLLAISIGLCPVSAISASELTLSAGGRVSTIDPALAADFISGYIVCAIYDTLLEYDYSARPYKLVPGMLEAMPETSPDSTSFKFRLRDDLLFADSGATAGWSREERRIGSKDVEYSIKRIADARLNSPGYWIFRGKIKGIDGFRKETSSLAPDDFSAYEKPVEGIRVLDGRTFEIHLSKPDPRFLYMLAMPYAAIVSRKAGLSGCDFSETTAASGPFVLSEWRRDYKMTFSRNCDFRRQTYPEAESAGDRDRPLPYVDRITCYLVRQPLSGWLMFLRGELDIGGVDRDNFDAVIDSGTKDIAPVLKDMGIKLAATPEFQINYVGFSFTDKRLAGNPTLRRAMSMAYDIEARIIHSNYALRPVNGPIPPGVAGHEDGFVNPNSVHDVEEARRLLAEAGYPDGIDPGTGRPLEFDFDLGDTSPYHRQIAELMVDDMGKIGIRINPVLNSKPKFFQKLSEGKTQLFRISWVGDYPDAENFLQLFYGPNAGKSNRAFYSDAKFDGMFAQVAAMPDCPERTRRYSEMARYVAGQCPWIFESSPVTYQLVHGWVENFIPHNFANGRWKYLSVNEKRKAELKAKIKPIAFH